MGWVMLPKSTATLGVIAILIAPLFTIILPEDITNTIITANVTLKDLALLSSIAVLAAINYSVSGFKFAARWLSRNPFNQQATFTYTYFSDGTVLIRNQFDYVNGWEKKSGLAREDLIWHKEITESDLLYRFYERGSLKDRRMTSDIPTIISAIPQKELGTDDFRYSWVPSVSPKLNIKERISFIVEIMASGTETAAFKAGTKMGFGVNISTRRARLIAYAPFGHRFVLVDPEVTVRRTDTLEEVAINAKKRPSPTISPDGSVLNLEVSNPSLGRRYWIHYRFEPV